MSDGDEALDQLHSRLERLENVRSGRFGIAGYLLLLRAIVVLVEEERGADFGAQHVLARFREQCSLELGLQAICHLDLWGVTSTEDVGRMVFDLAEAGLLTVRPGDSLADFEGAFDFESAFPLPGTD